MQISLKDNNWKIIIEGSECEFNINAELHKTIYSAKGLFMGMCSSMFDKAIEDKIKEIDRCI